MEGVVSETISSDISSPTTMVVLGEPIFRMQELDLGTKQSSPSSSNQNIFFEFLEIKKKNEALKAVTYIEFQKQISSTKNILLSTLDIEKSEFKLAFLEPKVYAPKVVGNYKIFILSFNTKQIDPIDRIDLHRQTSEMNYSSLTSYASYVSKLQNSLNNTLAKLKKENNSSVAKDVRIKSVEDLVIKLGLYPKNVDAA